MTRVPAGFKLVALTVAVFLVATIHRLEWVLGAAIFVTLLFLLARPNPRSVWQQLRPALIVAALALVINVWFVELTQAMLLSGRLLVALASAALFTLTTPATEVLDAVTRWLRPLIGEKRSERFALLVSLVIRTVPLMTDIVSEVLQARRARGMERSLRALVVPVVVRALRSADELGEAITARGILD